MLCLMPTQSHRSVPWRIWWGKIMIVRGVLGNKCAGQHNLKTVHFRETLSSVNFLACQPCVCFLQPSILPRKAAANFYVTMVGATPYKLFLKVPWVNKQLASSDFTFRRYKSPMVWNMWKMELGEHLYAFFHSQLLKKEGEMAFWALAWQKTSSVQTCLVF